MSVVLAECDETKEIVEMLREAGTRFKITTEADFGRPFGPTPPTPSFPVRRLRLGEAELSTFVLFQETTFGGPLDWSHIDRDPEPPQQPRETSSSVTPGYLLFWITPSLVCPEVP